MTIGYVGLGSMGGALAQRLQRTHPLAVYDRDPVAVQRLVDAGAVACESLPALAARAETILLCLPTSDHVREVLFGAAAGGAVGADAGGLARAARPGTLFVDQTSGDPNATRAMAADLRAAGHDLVDAPVSGGVAGAEAGTIAIMVGADPDAYARVAPLLHDISPNVFPTGAVGTGHTMKLVNNLLSGVQRLLTLEGVALAAKNGIEPATAVEVLLAGGGRNAYLEQGMGPRILQGDVGIGFSLALAHKDLRLACQLGLDSDVPMFFGNVAREVYRVCMREEGADASVDTAALVVDRLAGTQVVPRTER